MAELGRSKEEDADRAQGVKAALEQQLGHERMRYSLLEGQLQVRPEESVCVCAMFETTHGHSLTGGERRWNRRAGGS